MRAKYSEELMRFLMLGHRDLSMVLQVKVEKIFPGHVRLAIEFVDAADPSRSVVISDPRRLAEGETLTVTNLENAFSIEVGT